MKAQTASPTRPRPGARQALPAAAAATKAVATCSLTDEAYGQLKRKIIRCELPPDLLVTESQLVRESGLGKTPVREALARLVQEGLVRNIPRQGYEIAPITLGDVDELFGLRLIVEPAAAELAAGRVDAAELRALDALCASSADPDGGASGFERHLNANRALHVAIARVTGNRRLTEVVERLLDASERMFHLSLLFRNRRAEIMHEHHQLVEALIAGDGQTARQVLVAQIEAAMCNVTDALRSSPSILSAHVTPPVRMLA